VRTHGLSLTASAALGAVAGAVLWFLSGLANWAVASVSSGWDTAVALVLPPTVPVNTWLELSPWNLLIPTLGALLFGGLLGLGYGVLLRWRRWRSVSLGLVLLGGWIVSIIAAFLTATVWALGSTIANSSPISLSWAFRSAQPDLFASGYFGVIWGWLPALVVALVVTRQWSARLDVDGHTDVDAVQRAARRSGSRDTPRTTRSRSPWVFALVAFLTVTVGVGLVLVQPVAVRAERIAAGGTPDGLPTSTPTPTPTPAAAPPRVAPTRVQPASNWCVPEQISLTATATQGAMGHQTLTLVLINQAATPCVLDGYPDVAFADTDDHALAVAVIHGSSYTAPDPGPAEVTLAPGTSAEAHLGWNATGASAETAHSLWAAQYPGAERSELAINTDITGDSTVSVTAWALPTAVG
jgi:hypothetical protein